MKTIYFNISCFGCRKLKAMQERRLAWVSPAIRGREGLKPSSFASQFSSLATVQWCSKDSHDSLPGSLSNRKSNPTTDLILCSGLAWTCVEIIGVAGTFFLKQMWSSISVMRERKRKSSLFSEYILASGVIHFLLVLSSSYLLPMV